MSNTVTLMSPGRIGTLELRNRIFQSAMGPSLAEPDGTCGERVLSFYEARARGGAALVNMGAIGVAHPRGMVQPNQVAISGDHFITGLSTVVRAVQAHGARIAAQLQHGGPASTEDMIAGMPLWTSSIPPAQSGVLGGLLFEDEARSWPMGKITTPVSYRVMDKADIDHVVSQFVSASARAVAAGFDGIELHAAHGFLIRSFLSPAINSRTDEYGGSVENRARFLVEIISAIRAEIGAGFPLWCKFNVVEFNLENGFTVEDACAVARMAEAAGADAITASAFSGSGRGLGLVSGSAPIRPANYAAFAVKVREAVNIPVIAAGRIELDVGERLLGEGKVDFIGMGRKLLADPDLPRKIEQGKPEDIRPCIYCFTCLSEIALDRPVACAVNAVTGKETLLAFTQTGRSRHVVVVGGGPGGMEAARLLVARGHQVTLLEASDQLGGTARMAALAYAPNGKIVEWLKRQITGSSVVVRLGCRADLETVKGLEPDAVIVATGALRTRPAIPGSEQAHVYDGNELRELLTGERDASTRHARFSLATRIIMSAGRKLGLANSPESARRASRLWMPLKKHVVIIGGDLVGLELGEFLAHRGRIVTIVEEGTKFGRGLPPLRRGGVLDELESRGVALIPGATGIVIGTSHVRCVDGAGQSRGVKAQNVILAKGAGPNLALSDVLRGAGFETHSVGDCKGMGYILGAIRDAAETVSAMN